jgi:hypothetical protein
MSSEWKTLAEIEEGFGPGIDEILTIRGMLSEEKTPTQMSLDEGFSKEGLWNLIKIQALVAVLEMVDWKRWQKT